MLVTEEIRGDAAMAKMAREWDDLLHNGRCGGFFQTWEWVMCCRRHFGAGKPLSLITVRDDGKLVGLAAMETTLMYGLPLRRLQFIGTGTSDYLDFLLLDGYEESALQEIIRWITHHKSRWDLVDLQQFPENSPTLDVIPSIDLSAEYTIRLLKQEVCPYLPLAESWEACSSGLGKKMRSNLGYYERLLRRDFEVSIAALEPHELDEGMTAFFDLHTQRWRKRWLPGMLADGKRQKFHRELAKMAHKRGWLRLHGIRINGELQSVLYCFAHKNKAYYYLGGFDPALSRYSIGTVLTGHAIRDAIESGCEEFDFLRGDEAYKSRWTSDERWNHRLVLSRNNLRSKIASSIVNLERRIEQRVKRELHKRIGAG
jgi:CelD/BcsL family acetyltransferase involved in cellulose biosynthesis